MMRLVAELDTRVQCPAFDRRGHRSEHLL